MEKSCKTKLYKRPTKETYKRGLQKRLINETNEKKRNYERDLWKKPDQQNCTSDLRKRPIQEEYMHKKDLLLKTSQLHFVFCFSFLSHSRAKSDP